MRRITNIFSYWLAHTPGGRVRKALCHLGAMLLPHRSVGARLLKNRGIKRVLSIQAIHAWLQRLLGVCEAFDATSDTLFLGSSHILSGIMPASCQKLRAWVAAVPSGDLRTVFFLYRHFRQRWPKAAGQRVVVGVVLLHGAFVQEFAPDYFSCVMLHALIGMPYRNRFLMGRLQQVIDAWLPTLRRRGATAPSRGYFAYGESDAELPPAVRAQRLAARVASHRRFLTLPPKEIVWLERLIAEVEADGREVVFLYSPARADYRAGFHDLDPEAPFRELARKHRLLNAFALPLAPADWRDGDHLTDSGARHLTAWVEAQLQKP